MKKYSKTVVLFHLNQSYGETIAQMEQVSGTGYGTKFRLVDGRTLFITHGTRSGKLENFWYLLDSMQDDAVVTCCYPKQCKLNCSVLGVDFQFALPDWDGPVYTAYIRDPNNFDFSYVVVHAGKPLMENELWEIDRWLADN